MIERELGVLGKIFFIAIRHCTSICLEKFLETGRDEGSLSDLEKAIP